MNSRIVTKTISIFLMLIAFVMLIPFMIGLWYHEVQWSSFLMSSLIAFLLGGVGFFSFKNTNERMFSREAFAVVGFGWIIGSFFGALPYALSGTLGMVDAYFETVSGFTTTGASIITDIEALPRCILFWRALTNWLGGVGIVVLFVAVFPFLGVSGKQLFRSESSATTGESVKPKIRETAKSLWILYLGLTLVEIVLLVLGDVSIFDAICHSFATLATGGFSTYNLSVAAFHSPYVEYVITAFMFISGINFFVLYFFFTGRIRQARGLTELKCYTIIIGLATVFIFISLMKAFPGEALSDLFRKSLFQVTSIMTTTGFVSDNFEAWPSFTKILLVCLMFIGGCAGSTGGGMKVIRFLVAFLFVHNQVSKAIQAGSVKTIKISGRPINYDVQDAVLGFFMLSFFSVAFFSIVMAGTGIDPLTSVSCVISTLWNIGPGLHKIGAVENYAFISPFGKLVLSLCMILGRLEFIAIAAFFSPSFWRK